MRSFRRGVVALSALVAVVLLGVACQADAPGDRAQSIEVDAADQYEFQVDGRGSGTLADGRRIVVVHDGMTETVLDWDCHDIHEVRDFDGDGLDEALVVHAAGCGGNCCPNTYSFIDVTPQGEVRLTGHSMSAWSFPTLVDEGGRSTVTVVSEGAGFGYTTLDRTTQVFALEDSELVELSATIEVELPAIAEIRSDAKQDTELRFDLDGDGIDETIGCAYWDRWGVFNECSLIHGSDEPVALLLGGKRVGILDSSTNGWHDLVVDFDSIYTWNGSVYTLES